MLKYQIQGYRPAGIPLRQLGQAAPSAGTGAVVGMSSLLATTLGAGTVWIGIRAGEREKKGYKVMGYTVAVFGAIVVLSSLAGAAGFFTGLFKGNPAA